jgi:hypothetical protein
MKEKNSDKRNGNCGAREKSQKIYTDLTDS